MTKTHPASGAGPAGHVTRRGAPAAASARIAGDLRRLLKGDVEFDDISRHLYATDAGLNQVTPLGVVSPRETEDVVRMVEYAAEYGLPLIGRGMGSGLAGGAVGAGIQVDFTRYMNRVLEMAPDGSWARVQPGLVMANLNQEASKHGTFFAPDPSSENYCSLGGMIGTNSSGARTVAYGGTKDHVLALEAVLADGSTLAARPLAEGGAELAALLAGGTLAGRAFAAILPELRANAATIAAAMPRVVKNCSGYRLETVFGSAPALSRAAPGGGGAGPGPPAGAEDPAAVGAAGRDAAAAGPADRLVHLQKLFVGAEGTLGLVTEATLNLVPLPRRLGIAMAYFPSVFASGEAVPGILALGPTAVEIMDARFLALVRKHDSRIDAMLPEHTDTALLIEFEGTHDAEVDEKFAALGRHLAGTGVLKTVRAQTAEEADRLWTVRKSAVALALRMPGPRRALPFIEDVTVHPKEVPGYVDFLQRLFDRENVDAVMYGHVGDGNIHTRPLLDPKDPGDLRTMQRLYDEVSAYVRDIRGTMSGEHGDGLLRTPYLRQTYGDAIYSLFSLVKNAFDPQGLMNPGKKVGPQEERGSLLRDLRYGSDYHTLPQKPLLHFPGSEYEREIEKCHGCAQCKSTVVTTMCPTYKATRREAASPRAKANLLRAIITGRLDPASTYGETAAKTVSDYCIVCGMCAVECPSNVNIPKLMLEAKSKYREAHRSSPTDLLLGHAEAISALGSRFAPLANPLLSQPLVRRMAEPLIGIDRRRRMPRFARRTLGQPASGAAAPSASTHTVARPRLAAYFPDLYATYNDPELGLAVLRLLAAHGIEVVLPEQRSSGIPEMLYGYAYAAKDTAAYNVRSMLPWIQRGAVVLSAEPTATFAFKVHYPDYLASPDCSAVAEATHDLGEFLLRYRADHPDRALAARPLAGAWRAVRRIAYHQPCHLKAQQIDSPGLDLLREIPGLEVIDLTAGCCGMAGTFGMKKGTYDLSMLTGAPLFDRIAAVTPDIVASECSTCRLQIGEATSIRTVHPVMLLAAAYGV